MQLVSHYLIQSCGVSYPYAKVSSSNKERLTMSYIKRALEKIMFCEFCNGVGWEGWATEDDYSFEPCECNPHKLPSPNEF